MNEDHTTCENCGCQRDAAAPRHSEAQAPLSRRSALSRLLGLAASVLGLSLASGCPGGSTWGKESDDDVAPPNDFYFPLKDFPLNAIREIAIGSHATYVAHPKVRNENYYIALDRRCTHSGCRVSYDRGTLTLRCPCHGSAFDMLGYPVNGPAKRRLRTWEVVVEGEYVRVKVNSEHGVEAPPPERS